MKAYHGTNKRFEEFDGEFLGSHTGARDADYAFFFTTNRQDAAWYASHAAAKDPIDDEPIVYTVDLDIEKILNATGDEADKIDLLRQAELDGYDAVIWEQGNDNDLPGTIAVFDANKIRIVEA